MKGVGGVERVGDLGGGVWGMWGWVKMWGESLGGGVWERVVFDGMV